jgi:hypothetical protein
MDEDKTWSQPNTNLKKKHLAEKEIWDHLRRVWLDIPNDWVEMEPNLERYSKSNKG